MNGSVRFEMSLKLSQKLYYLDESQLINLKMKQHWKLMIWWDNIAQVNYSLLIKLGKSFTVWKYADIGIYKIPESMSNNHTRVSIVTGLRKVLCLYSHWPQAYP